jgi:hypothetical protein
MADVVFGGETLHWLEKVEFVTDMSRRWKEAHPRIYSGKLLAILNGYVRH